MGEGKCEQTIDSEQLRFYREFNAVCNEHVTTIRPKLSANSESEWVHPNQRYCKQRAVRNM